MKIDKKMLTDTSRATANGEGPGRVPGDSSLKIQVLPLALSLPPWPDGCPSGESPGAQGQWKFPKGQVPGAVGHIHRGCRPL